MLFGVTTDVGNEVPEKSGPWALSLYLYVNEEIRTQNNLAHNTSKTTSLILVFNFYGILCFRIN